jgi:sodium/potassium-transporting ATPase subunit alpha
MSILCTDKTGTLTVGKMVRFSSCSLIMLLDFLKNFPQSVENVAILDNQYRIRDIKEQFSQTTGASAPPAFQVLHKVARLCNGARFEAKAHFDPEERPAKGNATDVALLRFCESLDLLSGATSSGILASHDKVFEIPFNSTNKWMLTIVREGKVDASVPNPDPLMLVKGSRRPLPVLYQRS